MVTDEQNHAMDGLLRSVFGFTEFRPGQAEAIGCLGGGENAVVVMPTGAGKSLIYQLYAVSRPGVALVISPLISLMQDQVASLARRRVPAAFINSSIAAEEQSRRIESMVAGEYRLVYVAPERLRSTAFRQALAKVNVSLLAIDEAHCISQWGHDFRPDYLHIADARRSMGNPLTAALTATATPQVRADIAGMLDLKPVRHIVTGFNRPSLTFEVSYARDAPGKMRALSAMLGKLDGGAAIVYAGTRRDSEELAEFISQGVKIGAKAYHAGMGPDDRARVQDEFMSGRLQVVTATSAFGMGIDRPDVRLVAHYVIPGSLEEYYQEAGRGGRDGQPARAVLIYSPPDRALQEFFIESSALKIEDLRELHSALAAQGDNRRWTTVEEISLISGLHEVAVRVALAQLEAAEAVSVTAVDGMRMSIRLGEWSAAAVSEVAARSRTHLAHRREQLEWMVAYAESNDCRRRAILDHFGDPGTPDAPLCCDNCMVKSRVGPGSGDAGESGEVQAAEPSELTRENKTALLILDAVRRMPWEIGFGKLARILCGSKAKDMTEFDYNKIRCYGKLSVFTIEETSALIEQMISWGYLKTVGGDRPVLRLTNRGTDALASREKIALTFPRQIVMGRVPPPRGNRPERGESIEVTARMFEEGLSPEQIAEARGIAPSTVYLHLSQLISHGRAALERVIPADVVAMVRKAIGEVGGASLLGPVKALLPESVGYEHIRCVLAADGGTREPAHEGRAAEVVALGEQGLVENVPEIAAALSDPDGNVRRLAASALGKIGHTSGAEPLMDLLAQEQLPQVRQYAVKALGRIGDARARTLLERIAGDQTEAEYTRAAARFAVSRSRGGQSDGAEPASPPESRDAVDDYLSRPHPKPLAGPWKVGWSLGFHSSFAGSDWARSGVGDLTFRLKYREDRSALDPLVEEAEALIREHPELAAVDAIVPVPPSAVRQWEPVRLVADALGAKLGLPVAAMVTRTRRTQPQKEMRTLAQKRANVAEAFSASGEARGKRLLVVDDLYDSGATLDEIAKTLRSAGASAICVLTLTRTIHSDA